MKCIGPNNPLRSRPAPIKLFEDELGRSAAASLVTGFVMWPPEYRHFVEANAWAGKPVEIPDRDDLSGIGASIQLFNEADAASAIVRVLVSYEDLLKYLVT